MAGAGRTTRRAPHAEGDETSWPADGVKRWNGVGSGTWTTVFRTQFTRSGADAATMWEGYTGSLTRDGLNSYNSVTGAVHQMDLTHANRWLQEIEAKHGMETRGLLSRRGPKYTRAGRPVKEVLSFVEGERSRLAREVR